MTPGTQYIYPFSQEIIEIVSFYPANNPKIVTVKYINSATKDKCEHPIEHFKKEVESKRLVTI